MRPVTSIDDPRYVKAMSHPLRVRILAILQERTASPVELAQVLEGTLGTVSYHVRTLERFGLIKLVRTTPVRGAVERGVSVSLVTGRMTTSAREFAGILDEVPGLAHKLLSSMAGRLREADAKANSH